MNFARDVLGRRPRRRAPDRARPRRLPARVELRRGRRAQRAAGGRLRARGVRRGDVVMTLIGNRPEWVLAMLACFRIGAVVLPCTEQLRAKDLRLRIDVARPSLIVADERNRGGARGGDAPGCRGRCSIPDERLFAAEPAPRAPSSTAADPCLITFTSGTAGEPKAVVHGQRYLRGQRLQAEHWLGARAGELVWCTAASGWSKSARNVFIAPWLAGATRAAARRALRPARAARAARARARERALHGADRVPRDRQARHAAGAARACAGWWPPARR